MGLISILWGIVAMIWMVLALIPLVGITNWLLIPFAAIGAILAAIGIALTSAGKRGRAKTGHGLDNDQVLRIVQTVDALLENHAETRAEAQQNRMRAFMRRTALESTLRGGRSWQDFVAQMPDLSLELDVKRPVAMVLGKSPAHGARRWPSSSSRC